MSDAVYQTTDLSLAAYLVLRGFPLQGVNGQSRSRVEFLFSDKGGLNDAAMKFLNNKAKVEPSAYINKIKLLKAMAVNK